MVSKLQSIATSSTRPRRSTMSNIDRQPTTIGDLLDKMRAQEDGRSKTPALRPFAPRLCCFDPAILPRHTVGYRSAGYAEYIAGRSGWIKRHSSRNDTSAAASTGKPTSIDLHESERMICSIALMTGILCRTIGRYAPTACASATACFSCASDGSSGDFIGPAPFLPMQARTIRYTHVRVDLQGSRNAVFFTSFHDCSRLRCKLTEIQRAQLWLALPCYVCHAGCYRATL